MFLGLAEASGALNRRGSGVSHVQGLSLAQGQGWIASWPGSRHEGLPLLLTHPASPSETNTETIQDSVLPNTVKNKHVNVSSTLKA